MANWLPVIVTMITVIGGGLVYFYQKKIDRKADLIERRRECYANFLVSLTSHLTERSKSSHLEYQRRRTEVFILASDNVAKAAGTFFARSRKDEIEKSTESARSTLEAYAVMIREMRNDCYEKTELNDEEIMNAGPVSHSSLDESKKMKFTQIASSSPLVPSPLAGEG